MPSFVVLEHDHPELHWDFMLEHEGLLKTWRLPEFPPVRGRRLPVRALADHRLLYLDYEGPVSGNRGQVTRTDRGTYEFARFPDALPQECAENNFASQRLLLSLAGDRLCGLVLLERLEGNDWQLELLENV